MGPGQLTAPRAELTVTVNTQSRSE